MSTYCIQIEPESLALATFLNDGHVPEGDYLFIEVNGPREITSKVMRLHEAGNLPEDTLFFKK